MPYFHKWKLQPNKIPTAKEQWECTKLVLFSHFTIELPTVSAFYECNVVTYQGYILLQQIWLFHPLAESIGMSTYQVPFPDWKTMAPQVAFFFFFEDLFHFVGSSICLSPG